MNILLLWSKKDGKLVKDGMMLKDGTGMVKNQDGRCLLSLTLWHKVKIFRFSSLNSRKDLPILDSLLTGVGANRKKHVDSQ